MGFNKKVHIKTGRKKLYITRNERFQLTVFEKTALKRRPNAMFDMKIIDSGESRLNR